MAKSKGKRRQPHQRPPKAKKPNKAAKVAPEERKQPRAERIEAQRQAERRRSRWLRIGAMVAVVALLGGLIGWQVISRRNKQQSIAAMTEGACRHDTETDPGRAGEHVPNPSFAVNPPAGGAHTPAVSSAGVYNQQNLPPDGQLVHSLEHGYVVISHQPGISEEDMGILRDIQEDNEDDVLVVPRPSLDVPVAATAWHNRLLCDDVEPESLRLFVTEFVGKGPEKVPRG